MAQRVGAMGSAPE